jgi:mRNA-degrading endonuclease RelE of RelBE toxin-antitoxin system
MAFELRIKPKAEKNIDKLGEKDKLRVIIVLDDIKRDPFSGKKLHGNRAEQYSVRVWPYRIVYKIYKERHEIEVTDFDHRGSVYK